MNRHHPYGGHDLHSRRGHGGPGPERTGRGYRGRGGGRGGGRGMALPPYIDGHTFQQNGHYSSYSNEPPYDASGVSDSYDAQDQSYGTFEGSLKGPRPPVRREDPVAREHLIEQRIQRERPCRTLFIRNVKYETSSSYVRGMFEEHGEIKTFFDLISSRGMVFVTYFDIRAAERARDRLQGAELSGRPIDVHYSLPRAEEQTGECNRDKNQGTLLITLHHVSRHVIDEVELRRKFGQIGDVKSIKSVDFRPDQRYLEYYDTRACAEAFDRFQGDRMQDGTLELTFEWDAHEQLPVLGHTVSGSRDERYPRSDESRGRASGRGRGRGVDRGRGRGRGIVRGGVQMHNDWGDGGPRNRHDDTHDPFRPLGNDYGAPGGDTLGQPTQTDEDRYAQARQVQQLLAALKQPNPTSNPVPPSTTSYATQVSQLASMDPQNGPYYPPHNYSATPPASYGGTAPGSSYYPAPQNVVSSSAGGGLPPNVLQLLQQSQSMQGQGTQSSYSGQRYTPPPVNPLSPGVQNSHPSMPAYQQLMNLLSQKQGGTSK